MKVIKILVPVTAAELIASAHKKLITRAYKQKGERTEKSNPRLRDPTPLIDQIKTMSHNPKQKGAHHESKKLL